MLLCISVYLVHGTLEPLTKEEKKKGKEKKEQRPILKTVGERGLINTEPSSWAEVTKNYKKYSRNHVDKKMFKGDLLGFVTPWNNHGYDVAKTFGAKFNYISPVWLQIVPTTHGTFKIRGGHDIDAGWVRDVRANNTNVKIAPRLIFGEWSMAHLTQVTSSQGELMHLVQVVVEFFKGEKFDGVVLEIWRQFQGREKPRLHQIIKAISEGMSEEQMTTQLVIPPGVRPFPEIFDKFDFQILQPYIEKFVMMTYDHHHGTGKAGPVGPMDWGLRNILLIMEHENNDKFRHKLLYGVNFYGADFRGDGHFDAIVGSQYIDLLKSAKPSQFSWHLKASELSFEYRDNKQIHKVFYPSLRFIQKRVEAAERFKIGIAIWEIGQGLDYFFDLL